MRTRKHQNKKEGKKVHRILPSNMTLSFCKFGRKIKILMQLNMKNNLVKELITVSV